MLVELKQPAVCVPRFLTASLPKGRQADAKARDYALRRLLAGPWQGAHAIEARGGSTVKPSAWDGVIGARGRIKLGDGHWFAPYYLDLGAGQSDLTWQAFPFLGWQISDACSVQAGDPKALNVIPDLVEIGGTARAYSAHVRDQLEEEIGRLAKGTAAMFGIEVAYDGMDITV